MSKKQLSLDDFTGLKVNGNGRAQVQPPSSSVLSDSCRSILLCLPQVNEITKSYLRSTLLCVEEGDESFTTSMSASSC